MPQIEYGHLHKFIVSIGLVLIGSAVAVHWAVIRETGTLTITREELGRLTPVARDALIQRQAQLSTITDWYQFFCVLLAVAGLFCVIYGVVRWGPQQKQSDEVARAEGAERVRQLATASQEERAQKVEAEVNEVRSDADAEGVVQHERPRGRPNAPAEPERGDQGLPGVGRRTSSFAQSYHAIEERFSTLFKEALQTHYLVRDDVAVGPANQDGRRRVADLVAVSTSGAYPDLVFEFKYVRAFSALDRRVRDARLAASAASSALQEGNPRRRTIPVAVVVSGGDVPDDAIHWLERMSSRDFLVIFLTEDEFDSIEPVELWERLQRSLKRIGAL